MENVSFANPGFFWLFLLLIPAIGWYVWKRKQQAATLRMSSLNGFRAAPSPLATLLPVLFILRLLAVSFIIIALARPQKADVNSRIHATNGIDIVMAIDVSESMLARDLRPNRLEALKKVASRFVDGRPNDRIGLVVYAGESYTKTPVTSDKELVKAAIQSITYDGFILADGTGIGNGLATAINRLKDSKAKSRIIILLTDGVNNTGTIQPQTAAEIAKEYGIKVYTIGIGTTGNAESPYAVAPDGSLIYRMMPVKIDQDLMKSIARTTNGKYFRATSNTRLKAIYDEINKLETSEVTETRYYNYDEKFRPFALAALGLLVVELLARKTIFRSFI